MWDSCKHALSFSLVSFGGWCIGSLITALYAWLLLKDRIFTAVSLGNLAGSGAVFLIAANNRLGAGRDRGSTFGGYLHGTKRTTLRVSPRTVRMRRGY